MHVAICQAVTDFLNLAATKTALAKTYTAVRKNVPILEIGTDGTSVFVHPGNRARTSNTRGDVGFTYEVIVTVGERVTSQENAAIDPLINFVENMERELLKEENWIQGGATLSRIEAVYATPPFIPEELSSNHTFYAQVPLTYVNYPTS